MKKTRDFRFECHGSIWLVRPQGEAAGGHLRESVQADAQWMGEALVVEHRYVCGLADGLRRDGFTVGR